MHLIHQIFILDAQLSTSLNEARCQEITKDFIKELVHSLGMVELGPLEIYPATDKEYPGWSFIQPITTSHISGHYFYNPRGESHIHLDVYSCKAFEWKTVVDVCENHLKLAEWSANFVHRTLDLEERKVWELKGRGNDLSVKNLLK